MRRQGRCLVAAVLLCIGLECTAGPSNRPKLLDDRGGEVTFACVVPLYAKVSGMSLGPEGKPKYSAELHLQRPFRFMSGDDFLANVVPWGRKVAFVGTVVAFGDGWELDTRLLLRSGYMPVTPALYNKYVEKSLVMPRSSGREAEEALEAILATPPDQDKLHAFFKVKEPIRVELSPEDIQLLRSCVEGNAKGPKGAGSN